MKLAMINRMLGFNRGGGEMWDLNIARELEELGVDVTFVIAKPLYGETPNPVNEFDTIQIPIPHLKDLSYAAPKGVGGLLADIDSQLFTRRVASRLKNSDHDLIHVNSDPRFGRVVSTFDRPVTITMHGPPHSLWHDYVNPFSSSYDFFLIFDAVIATGITTPDIRRHTKCDVTTINPGVDTDLFRPNGPSAYSDSGDIILWVGRLVPSKNLMELLAGFNQLRGSEIEANLVVVGDGPLRSRLEQKVSSYNLEDSVHFEGYIPNEKLPPYYRGADVFALSSHHESFGMVLLEAMACGTPVVAPQIDYIPEIVTDGEVGLLYEAGDAGVLSNKLKRLLNNPKRRNEMGQHARETVTSKFVWEKQAKKLFMCFDQLI